MAKLGDICTIQSGGTPSRSNKDYWDNGTIPWVKISDFSGKYLSQTSEKITQAGLDGSSAKIFPKGTILYTIFATLGETCILDIDATTNQAIAGLKLNDDSVLLDYLYYYLLSKKEYVNEIGRGVAQNNINMKILREMEIAIPPKEEQNKITDVLNKVYELIAMRKEQLAKLDQLVKSRFIELFGDPICNPKDWKTDKTENYIDLLSGFPFDSSQYTENGINICGGLIIMPQRIEWKDCKHWSSVEGYEEYTLKENDIVIALDRPWISEGFKIAMVDAEHLPALLIQRTARIRAIGINQLYLMYCFLLGGFDKHCNVTGSLVPHISAKDIRSFAITMPPLELQEKFADFVEQTDKSKLAIQQSLDKLEILKKSLMQEYFG